MDRNGCRRLVFRLLNMVHVTKPKCEPSRQVVNTTWLPGTAKDVSGPEEFKLDAAMALVGLDPKP
jgi:hypothetical protein